MFAQKRRSLSLPKNNVYYTANERDRRLGLWISDLGEDLFLISSLLRA